jgi:type IV secretory pathway VirB10-like protein
MARPSPITIGLTALMAAILALAVWLFARPRHPVPEATPTEADEGTAPAAPAPAPPPPPPVRTAPAPRRAPAPVVAAEPPPSAPAGAETDDAGGLPARVPASLRRDVLVRTQNLRLSEADEETFRKLNLPDATRARIREINEDHRLRTERSFSSADPAPAASAGAALTAREARLVALRQVLGAEGAQQFDAEERAAVRKLRGKYRFEWGRQLRQ